MAEPVNEQEVRRELEKYFPEGPTDVKVDPCEIYNKIPDWLKKQIGEWIGSVLGPAAKRFYDALIAIADKCCKEKKNNG